jgi:AraC family transcriptional regulator, activator of mtrCDE
MAGWQDLIEFHDARTSSFELHGAWAGKVTGCGYPGFYLVEQGSLLVSLEQQRYRLDAGDILLIPRSSDHVLSSQGNVAVEPIEDITGRAVQRGESFVVGEGTAGLKVRSAAFLARPLTVGWLPPALKLSRSEGSPALRCMLMALVHELSSGTRAALCPLSEAVFVKAMDAATHTAHLDIDILSAMGEARMAPARFASVHALARAAGLSRSRFSERFALAFGVSPMRWLRQVRMEAARAELVDGRSSVAQVAERFGYSSESAFRKAYQRLLREPATVNRARRGGSTKSS